MLVCDTSIVLVFIWFVIFNLVKYFVGGYFICCLISGVFDSQSMALDIAHVYALLGEDWVDMWCIFLLEEICIYQNRDIPDFVVFPYSSLCFSL